MLMVYKHVGVATFLSILMCGCGYTVYQHRPGTTTGQIFVNSPKVVAREALVNDRLTQANWLNDVLAKSSDVRFDDSFQAITELSSYSGLTSKTEIGYDPLSEVTQELDIQYKRSEIAKAQIDADIELAKKKNYLEEVKNKKLFDEPTKEGNPAASKDPAELDPPASDSKPPSGGAGGAANSTDDKTGGGAKNPPSDKQANGDSKNPPPKEPSDPTQETKALLPSARDIATTKAKPSPVDVFRDRLAYREEIRNEIIDNQLDDRHELRGNTLYRLKIDATVLPEHDTSAWAKVTYKLVKPAQDDNFDALYRAWISALDRHLNTLLSAWTQAASTENGLTFVPRNIILHMDSEARDIAIPEKEGKVARNDHEKRTAGSIELKNIDLDDQQHSALVGIALWNWIEVLLDPTHNAAIPSLCARLREEKGDASLAKERARKCLARHLLVNALIKEYKTNLGLEQFSSICALAGQSVQVKGLNGNLAPESFKTALRKLDSTGSAYVYASTPKESVDRISQIAARSTSTDIAFTLEFLRGRVNAKQYLQLVSQSEGLFNAIRRQPLVVGFSEAEEVERKTEPKRPGHLGAFGWIIGPRFTITNDGKGGHFRHLPIQHGLSATVSVPAWWRELTLELTTEWIHEDGRPATAKNARDATPRTVTVRLPNDPLDLTAALASDWKRYPAPEIRTVSNYVFDVGTNAKLVIAGSNLWRQPKISLGSQVTDKVTVLPGMTGILADFGDVQDPGGWDQTRCNDKACEKEVAVIVWTSTGPAQVGKAILRKAAPKAPTPAAAKKLEMGFAHQYMIFDSFPTLRVPAGTIPAGAKNVSVEIQHNGAWIALQTYDHAACPDSAQCVHFRVRSADKKVSLRSDAALVSVRVGYSKKDDEKSSYFQVPGKFVMYGSRDDASMKATLRLDNTNLRKLYVRLEMPHLWNLANPALAATKEPQFALFKGVSEIKNAKPEHNCDFTKHTMGGCKVDFSINEGQFSMGKNSTTIDLRVRDNNVSIEMPDLIWMHDLRHDDKK